MGARLWKEGVHPMPSKVGVAPKYSGDFGDLGDFSGDLGIFSSETTTKGGMPLTNASPPSDGAVATLGESGPSLGGAQSTTSTPRRAEGAEGAAEGPAAASGAPAVLPKVAGGVAGEALWATAEALATVGRARTLNGRHMGTSSGEGVGRPDGGTAPSLPTASSNSSTSMALDSAAASSSASRAAASTLTANAAAAASASSPSAASSASSAVELCIGRSTTSSIAVGFEFCRCCAASVSGPGEGASEEGGPKEVNAAPTPDAKRLAPYLRQAATSRPSEAAMVARGEGSARETMSVGHGGVDAPATTAATTVKGAELHV